MGPFMALRDHDHHGFLPFTSLFMHFLSGGLHLLFLLLCLIICLSRRKPKSDSQRKTQYRQSSILLRLTQVCTSALFCVFGFLSIFNYIKFWDGGSMEIVVTQVDFLVQIIAWGAITWFLISGLSEKSFPLWIRSWWTLFFIISLYGSVVDVIVLGLDGYAWVNVLSACIGFFLCCACFFGDTGIEQESNGDIREALLANRDSEKKKEIVEGVALTPYVSAGFFSLLSLSWMTPLLSYGCKKELDLTDVPQVPDCDRAKFAYPAFRVRLDDENKSGGGGGGAIGKFKLAKAILVIVWKDLGIAGLLSFVCTCASYVGPYMINSLVRYLSGIHKSRHEGYLLASIFLGVKVLGCLSRRHMHFITRFVVIRVRAALNSMIYEKGLMLSSQSRQGRTNGEVINLMSVDAERVALFCWYIHDVWTQPIEISLAFLILYTNIGFACFAAIGASFIVMLVNIPLSKKQESVQEKIMESKDNRMKATTEILKNMRVLKYQAWEMKFLSKIMELRQTEVNWLRKCLYVMAATQFALWQATTFVSVVSFGSCLFFRIPLTTGRILSALATFGVLQGTINALPEEISTFVQTKVSLDRIASFLTLQDIQQDAVTKSPRDPSSLAVEICEGVFSWDPSLSNPTLKCINLRVKHGMHVAVCGTVGSGKTSLLSSVLGEIPKISGSVKLSGTTAYVAQSPWIQTGKIVENILFGKDMDREKYERVLGVCALRKDLEILPLGDETIVGERGINLSGGQKQRLQIARAIYQDADIYLFDDPFSAVDAHTGEHLFRECLNGFLRSRTVIYVTHQLEFLSSADLILVMKDGEIVEAGVYNNIIRSGSVFTKLVGAHGEALSSVTATESAAHSQPSYMNESDKNSVEGNEQSGDSLKNDTDDKSSKADEKVGTGQLIQEEEKEKGNVGLSVYWEYITACYGGALVPFIFLSQIVAQILSIASGYWMATATPVSKDQPPPVSSSTLILVYMAMSLTSSIFELIGVILLGTAGYKTATMLFNKMMMSIFRSSMSFFDATPTGRILTRVSNDQNAVDLSIPQTMGSCLALVITFLGVIAVTSQAAWQIFILFIPVIIICIRLQQVSQPAARELSRMVGVTRSPILQHFAESIGGAATIRSCNQRSRFLSKNFDLIDDFSRPKFHYSGAIEWLGFRLDILSSLAFACTLLFLIFVPEGMISPGVAGLIVTYGLTLNELQAGLIWSLCSLENSMISVERILQYTHIPSEPRLEVESHKSNICWPSIGEINVIDIKVQYAPQLPLVLRGLSCTFYGGKKTGVVGRTGSGKSTLVQTLFRVVDPVHGSIVIDGVNILSIGLHDLRSKLSIIPQEPTMFQGTVRTNLDPLEEHTDEEIWEALYKCQLSEVVKEKEGKLDSIVNENGDNWSVGQRQLICLGRVLLKKNKILVLDEATASIDAATDSLIQMTLKEHFSDCTVITIAHRIASILDSHMIVLVDDGIVAEFDTPARLLQDKSSAFSMLVNEYMARSTSIAAKDE